MDFVEICNVCARKVIIKAAKRIINSDKICCSYSDLNIGVTFLERSVEAKLVLITNRKSHTDFRLVLTSITLNDLERRNSPYFAFFNEFDCIAGQLRHSG